MSLTRKEEFSERDVLLAEWCKALAHPARVAILKTLAKQKECICGTLVLNLPLAQSTVSQHLKVLKDAGLIKGTVEGTQSRYCIHRANFKKLIKYFGNFTKNMDCFNRC